MLRKPAWLHDVVRIDDNGLIHSNARDREKELGELGGAQALLLQVEAVVIGSDPRHDG
ncbi:MAG: hypothetical protein AAGA32_11850 [Pseudomonadota bacterium]